MYVVTGALSRTGRALVDQLLRAYLDVRVVVDDPAQGEAFAARGCEVVAPGAEEGGWVEALTGAEAVWLQLPGPASGPEGRAPLDEDAVVAYAERVVASARQASVPRVVLRSSLGAHDPGEVPLLRALARAEAAVTGLGEEVGVVLRAPVFLDHWCADLEDASRTGVVAARHDPEVVLRPVSTIDLARQAAQALIDDDIAGVVELAGPDVLSLSDFAARVAARWGRPLRVERVTGADRTGLFGAVDGGRVVPEHPEDVRTTDSPLDEALDELGVA